jgi:hypothetical protein
MKNVSEFGGKKIQVLTALDDGCHFSVGWMIFLIFFRNKILLLSFSDFSSE